MNLTQPNSLLRVAPSPIRGTGLFASGETAPGTRVIEYTGERINSQEMLARCAAGNFFIFALREGEYLDGAVDSNMARWINHSCEPNCEIVCEAGQLWIIAKRDIAPDEEITFNYSYDLEDYRQHPCHCGSAECVGYIVAEEFFEHVRSRKVHELEMEAGPDTRLNSTGRNQSIAA